jgi:hypothetical protein
MGVSELGTIGTRSEIFMSITTMLLALFSVFFSIGFYKACQHIGISTIPALLSFAMTISLAWGAIFPSGNDLHGTLGPLPLFIMLGSLLSSILWRGNKSFITIRIFSMVSFLIMLLFILRFVPSLQQKFEGLIQRCLWLGWSVWYIALSFWLVKLITKKKSSIVFQKAA